MTTVGKSFSGVSAEEKAVADSIVPNELFDDTGTNRTGFVIEQASAVILPKASGSIEVDKTISEIE